MLKKIREEIDAFRKFDPEGWTFMKNKMKSMARVSFHNRNKWSQKATLKQHSKILKKLTQFLSLLCELELL